MNMVVTVARTRIGKLIAERRKQRGLKQKDLARLLKTTEASMAAIEQGRTQVPDMELLAQLPALIPISVIEIVDALKLPIKDEIAMFDGDPKKASFLRAFRSLAADQMVQLYQMGRITFLDWDISDDLNQELTEQQEERDAEGERRRQRRQHKPDPKADRGA